MALYTLRSGATQHPEDSVLQFFTDVVRASGVIGIAGGSLEVTEKSGTPDMSVDIAAGRAVVKKSSSNAYPIRNTASANETITSNASGNPRIDTVVLYADLGASPTTDADNVATLTVVEGSAAASPSAPSDSDIETAIGASNPYVRLANVTVASGASEITDANITDVRPQPFIHAYTPVVDVDYAASVTPDYADGRRQKIDLTGDITIEEPSNFNVGDELELLLVQDATGSHEVTFNFTHSTPFEAGAVIDPAANQTTRVSIVKKSSSTYHVTTSNVVNRGFSWSIQGTLAVGNGQGAKYVVPQAMTLKKLWGEIESGTSAGVRINKNGSSLATATITTTAGDTSVSGSLAAGDVLTFDITTVTGSPEFIGVTLECSQP